MNQSYGRTGSMQKGSTAFSGASHYQDNNVGGATYITEVPGGDNGGGEGPTREQLLMQLS